MFVNVCVCVEVWVCVCTGVRVACVCVICVCVDVGVVSTASSSWRVCVTYLNQTVAKDCNNKDSRSEEKKRSGP